MRGKDHMKKIDLKHKYKKNVREELGNIIRDHINRTWYLGYHHEWYRLCPSLPDEKVAYWNSKFTILILLCSNIKLLI